MFRWIGRFDLWFLMYTWPGCETEPLLDHWFYRLNRVINLMFSLLVNTTLGLWRQTEVSIDKCGFIHIYTIWVPLFRKTFNKKWFFLKLCCLTVANGCTFLVSRVNSKLEWGAYRSLFFGSHVIADGIPLVWGHFKSAVNGEQCHGAPTVSFERTVSVDVADIMKERSNDEAVCRNMSASPFGKLICLKCMVGHSAGVSVVAVATYRKVVAVLKKWDDIFNTVSLCRAEKLDDPCSNVHIWLVKMKLFCCVVICAVTCVVIIRMIVKTTLQLIMVVTMILNESFRLLSKPCCLVNLVWNRINDIGWLPGGISLLDHSVGIV